MPFPTAHEDGAGQVSVDADNCTGCGRCISACPAFILHKDRHGKAAEKDGAFGCIACGHCMMLCPHDAIHVHGRGLSPDDILPTPAKTASYDDLYALMLKRRSIRSFTDAPVSDDDCAKIVDAIKTAPMGFPPGDVTCFLLQGREKVEAFRQDVTQAIERSRFFFSAPFLALLRLFIGKYAYQSFKQTLRPLIDLILAKDKEGEDVLFYEAPTLLYIYSSAYMDPADAHIAATYGMLAAESLGVGSCMIGTVAPMFKAQKSLRQKWGIPDWHGGGICLILGTAKQSFPHVVKRKGYPIDRK